MFQLSPVAQNIYTAVINRTCSMAMLQEFIFIQRRLPQDQRSLSDEEISRLVEKISQVVLGHFSDREEEGSESIQKPPFVVPSGVTHAGCYALQRRLKKEASSAQCGIKPRPPRSSSALAIMQSFGCDEPTAGSILQRSFSSPGTL